MRQSNPQKKVRLSTIYTRYFDSYLKDTKYPVSKEVLKAVNQTIACRTSRIGVNVYECPDCRERKYVLRSCKNRFCPQCGYADTKRWAINMLGKIADCAHHHIIFTLPASLRGISKKNKDKIHSLLLQTSSEAILDWFQAKYKLTAGIINVLHTAGSDQKYHPHAHMICSAGGIDSTGHFRVLQESWYLVNQGFLSKKFRWHFERGLLGLYKKGELKTEFENEISFKYYIKQVNKQDWVVSIQRPLKKMEDIVNYVGRYTKRACISEYNILSADDGEIRFRHKDYKQTDDKGLPFLCETMLGYRDFFGRLFEHVPSKGFRMVRYYGIYSNRKIKEQLKGSKKQSKETKNNSWREYQLQKTGKDPLLCACCGKEMVRVSDYYDHRTRWQRMQMKDKIPDYWPVAV
jgi:hypothetical protein